MTQDPHLHLISHALIEDRLGKMRDKNTSPMLFRQYTRDIGRILAVHATAHLPTTPIEIETPITATSVNRLSGPTPLIVPILRAGLGVSQEFEDLLPEADTGHIGVYRHKTTKLPVEYLIKLPPQCDRPIFICDPILASGHSMLKTIEILLAHGAKEDKIIIASIVSVPEGLALLREKHKTIPIYTAAIDSHLNENVHIVPGLGDAGDRFFGTL